VYPALLVITASLLVWGTGGREATKIWIERIQGPSFVELPDGKISSQARIKIENESDEPRSYSIDLSHAPDAALRAPQLTWQIKSRSSMEIPLFVDVPRASFTHGKRTVHLRVHDDRGFARIMTLTLLGPEGSPR
jgi:hypothetical protein